MVERLTDYDLITLDEAKDILKITEAMDQDSSIIQYVRGITQLIQRYCGSEFISKERTETFDGDSTNTYFTKFRPISAVGNVVYNEDGDIVPSGSVKNDPNRGIIYLDDNYIFYPGFQNCSVTYTAGYSETPPGIKLAASKLLIEYWKKRDKRTDGVISVSMPNQTITFEISDMPAEIKGMLNLYRKVRI